MATPQELSNSEMQMTKVHENDDHHTIIHVQNNDIAPSSSTMSTVHNPAVSTTCVDSTSVSSSLGVTYSWEDVTQDFFKAAEELALGELLHDENFGLFEAMSAIEMMDPKMDAGMMCNRGNKRVLNFDQAVKANKLKLDNLTTEEQIGIIDATLACLVTWFEGHSLAQTVFTNLYLHKHHAIEDRVVKAFSVCLLKLVDLVRDFINKAGVFEEEDFQPVLYGYKLATDISDVRASGMMREVEEELQRSLKGARSKTGKNDNGVQTQPKGLDALYYRIKFCRLFYQTLLLISKKKTSGVEEVERLIQQMLELFPLLQRTIGFGIQPDPTTEHVSKANYPTIMGFEPLINQRLLPPTFPRYTKIKSRTEAMNYLEQLVGRLRTVCRVTECTSFFSAVDFFSEFSKLSPCVLSRSILHQLNFPQPGKILGNQQVVDVLRDAIRNFIKPPALMPRSPVLNNPQIKENVEVFLNHCVRPFCILLQIYGHNRARQRDKLAHLLEELAALQDEADKVDAYLNNFFMKSENPCSHLACFGTWVLYYTLKVMIQYILTGFELELYSTHEYTYIFWYLHEFLYGWLVSALSRADGFILEQEAKAEHLKGRNAKKNKRKKKIHPHGREILLNQALQNLCGGYYKVVIGFGLAGKLKKPVVEFDNEQVRYEHRFAPFSAVLTPPPVSYAQYREMTNLSRYLNPPTAEDMYQAACKCFHNARMLLENVPDPTEDVSNIMKIAKMNFVVVKLLLSGHKSNSKELPGFDFSFHKNFPVIRIM